MSECINDAIEFNRPYVAKNSFAYMQLAVENAHTCGDGPFTKRCQGFLERKIGVARALMTTSCTDALEMAAVLLNIQPGDEVILPSFTFVSTANAFVLRGAKPVFCDIKPDTLNLDVERLEALIGSRTKAIVPVHYAGVACEMDEIMGVADSYGVPVVEDNAHGLFGKYKGKNLGTIGAMATQSFHETKNFNCGEGGALLINENKYIERAEIIREKGTNRNRFFRGLVDKYTWVDIGSSHLPSDLLSAYLYAQFEVSDEIQSFRENTWKLYDESLRGWADNFGVTQPSVPSHCDQAFHMYYLLMPSLATRQGLIQHLKQLSITSPFHYLPLHLSSMGMKFGSSLGDCPVTESISDRIIRLPFHNSIMSSELDRVIDGIKSFKLS